MNVKVISQVEEASLKTDLPELKIGDTIRLGLKVVDKKDTRIQNFEGILIRMSGSGLRKTLTVRKIGANGVGVERIIPVHSPILSKIEMISRPKRARKARLYYLRDRVGKAATNLNR